jgi:hypothetical protein
MDAGITEKAKPHNQQSESFLKTTLLPILALALALSAQWLLLNSDISPLFAALIFVAAISLYLISITDWPGAALKPHTSGSSDISWRPIITSRPQRVVLAAATFLLAVWSYAHFNGNTLKNGFWPWVGSIILFVIAFAWIPDYGTNELGQYLIKWWRNIDKRVLLVLGAIILLGTFFRFYRLQEIPLEMTSDHAEKILDVQDVLDGSRPIFFRRNTGRELFQFYLTAGIIRLTDLPNSHLTLKIGTAIFGLVALPFTFLLGQFLYGRFVGLLAMFFLSISHWHVAITRMGLRFPFTAAFATPVIYFLLRALRTNNRNNWLSAAFFLGVGLHTYTPMRIVPVLCAVLIYFKLLFDGLRKYKKKTVDDVDSWTRAFWKNCFLMLSFTVLLLLPLLRFMADNSGVVWARSFSRIQTNISPTLLTLTLQFLENIKNALLMFNYRGDVVLVNTIPGDPVLGLVSGALFLLGLAYLLWRLFRYKDHRSLIMLVSLFTLLLPSILSLAYPGENPSVVRSGGAVSIVMIAAAIPLATILLRFNSSNNRQGILLALACLALLIGVSIVDNFVWYFRDYDAQYQYSIANATELGNVLKEFEEEGGNVDNAYHVPYPHWVDTRNIGINAGHVRWNNAILDPQEIYNHVFLPRPRLYLLHTDDATNLYNLQELFPDGRVTRYNSSRVGKDFIIFYVPAIAADS